MPNTLTSTGSKRGVIAVGLAVLAGALLVAPGAAGAQERTKVSVAGAGPGAAAYVIWGGLAALVTRESKTVEMSNLTTRGAVEDIRLVEAKKAEFGLGVSTLVQFALTGQKMFKQPYQNIRGLGPGTVSLFHVAVRKDSGITKIAELAGKRISFAEKGSMTHVMTTSMFDIAGMQVREENLNWDVAADAMRDGRLDAFTIPNPLNSPSILKASTAQPITLLPVEGKLLDAMLKVNGAFFKTTIPAGSYDGVDKDVPTIGYTAWTIVGAHVPDAVVYEVTRLNYSPKGQDFLLKVHRGWATGFKIAPALDQMAAIGMKLHPGAARYWKEQGHDIPKQIE